MAFSDQEHVHLQVASAKCLAFLFPPLARRVGFITRLALAVLTNEVRIHLIFPASVSSFLANNSTAGEHAARHASISGSGAPLGMMLRIRFTTSSIVSHSAFSRLDTTASM